MFYCSFLVSGIIIVFPQSLNIKTIIMKKVLLIMFVLTFAANTYAQKVEFGVKAGINVSDLQMENFDFNTRTGIHLGGIVEFKLTDKFALQPELLYSQLGARAEIADVKIDADYLALPVMAKYYIVKGLSIEAGPQFSLLVNDVITLTDKTEIDGDTGIEEFDLALNAGLGYQFKNGIFFQTRYSLGLTAVGQEPKTKNRSFQFSLGFQF